MSYHKISASYEIQKKIPSTHSIHAMNIADKNERDIPRSKTFVIFEHGVIYNNIFEGFLPKFNLTLTIFFL